MQALRPLVRAVVEDGYTLPRAEASGLLTAVLEAAEEHLASPHSQAELAALLTALAVRGETPEELAGFVDSLRAAAVPLPLTDEERATLVDTCGTGGDALGTFNISTAAALVAAAAGARVAKHGNRAVTSQTGSADVLQQLGVPIDLAPEQAAECLRQTGFVFLLAPHYHPTLRRLLPLRRALPFRTIFHLAGPLSNPAGAPAQVMGVWNPARIPIVARAMQLLGVREAFVVHGESERGGMDEWTTTGTTHYVHLRRAAPEPQTLTPETLELPRASLLSLQAGDSPQASAQSILAILSGADRGPRRDIVLLNASAALVVAGVSPDLHAGLVQAARAIDSGAAPRLLEALQHFRGAYD